MSDNKSENQDIDDLDQLLNNALNELNDPSIIKDIPQNDKNSSDPLVEDQDLLNQLSDSFKKLMDSTNDKGFDETMLDTIKKLEENMKEFPEDVPSEEEMSKIWSQMTNQGNQDDIFPPFFLDIMQKLLAKEVLYPSLKDLSTKFPDWLSSNQEKLSKEDLKRFSKQQKLVDEVCRLYEEEPNEKGTINNKSFQKILTAMQEMQQCGAPPEDLVGDAKNFKPTSMEEFNKIMECNQNTDQCKTM